MGVRSWTLQENLHQGPSKDQSHALHFRALSYWEGTQKWHQESPGLSLRQRRVLRSSSSGKSLHFPSKVMPQQLWGSPGKMPLAINSWSGTCLHSWQRGSWELVLPKMYRTQERTSCQMGVLLLQRHTTSWPGNSISSFFYMWVTSMSSCGCAHGFCCYHTAPVQKSSPPCIHTGQHAQGSFPQRSPRKPWGPSRIAPLKETSCLIAWSLYILITWLPQTLPSNLAPCHQAWLCWPRGSFHHIHPVSFLFSGWKLIHLSSLLVWFNDSTLHTQSALLTPYFSTSLPVPASGSEKPGFVAASVVH